MDLFSLDGSTATLSRIQTKVNYSKIDPEKLREAVKSQNENSSLFSVSDVEDKLTIGQEIAKAEPFTMASTAFFNSNFEGTADENGNIKIEDTVFSEEEFKNCRALIQNMRSDLKTKSYLDYDDYAKQTLMTNIVSSYAEKDLNEDQAKVLNSAVSDYVKSQQALATINSEKEKASSFKGIKDYYGKSEVISKEYADNINKSFSSIGFKSSIKAGTETILPQATNEEIKKSITDLFSKVNLNDPDEFEKALSSYKELLKPVYSTLNYGIGDKEINNLAESKCNDLRKLVNSYRTYLSSSVSEYA